MLLRDGRARRVIHDTSDNNVSVAFLDMDDVAPMASSSVASSPVAPAPLHRADTLVLEDLGDDGDEVRVACGCWVLGVGCWVLGVGCWMLGVGCWVLGVGCWVLGVGAAPDGWVLGCWGVGLGGSGRPVGHVVGANLCGR